MPFHFEELKLVDLKMSSKCIEDLLGLIVTKGQLSKLALVNIKLAEKHI